MRDSDLKSNLLLDTEYSIRSWFMKMKGHGLMSVTNSHDIRTQLIEDSTAVHPRTREACVLQEINRAKPKSHWWWFTGESTSRWLVLEEHMCVLNLWWRIIIPFLSIALARLIVDAAWISPFKSIQQPGVPFGCATQLVWALMSPHHPSKGYSCRSYPWQCSDHRNRSSCMIYHR
jgi:hypothetical protein